MMQKFSPMARMSTLSMEDENNQGPTITNRAAATLLSRKSIEPVTA
jgi:hypothetical protein